MNKIQPSERYTRVKSTMIEVAAIISFALVLLNGISDEAIRFVRKVGGLLLGQ